MLPGLKKRLILSKIAPMVRLFHTSDWHLGRVLFGKNLIEDQSEALDEILRLIDAHQPHGLLISGDVFDRSLPPEDAIRLLNQFLLQVIKDKKTPVFLIPGNHDSAERLGFASHLLKDSRLHIFSRLEDSFHPVVLEGDDGVSVQIFGIPYIDPISIAQYLNDFNLRTHDEGLRALCKKIRQPMNANLSSVLLCHAFVAGGEESDSEKDLAIGGSSVVHVSAFEGFSYSALGHLHKPQTLAQGKIRYSGSLFKYSKSEAKHRKSITEVFFDDNGLSHSKEHFITTRRTLHYLEGELESLIDLGKSLQSETPAPVTQEIEPRSEDYIITGLTDQGAIVDAFSRLRTVFPNLLHTSRVDRFQPKTLAGVSINQQKNKSELDLFAEFFREATGTELNPEERSILIESLDDKTLCEAT